jgi:hypothetical protein
MHKREKSLNEFELQILYINCLYLYIVVGTDVIIKSGKVGVIDCLYLYIVVGTDLIIKSGKVGVSLNGLTTQHLFACFKPEPGFLTSYVMVFFFVFDGFR